VAGWLWAFKAIPWGDVIAAAPGVAQNAKKLWGSMRNQGASGVAARAATPEARIQILEDQVVELRRENAASSEVLKSLAEQNARLVEAVEILRARSRIALGACAAISLLALGLVVWLIVR
jgi:hypothetical protein